MAGCAWDGLDCDTGEVYLARGSLIVYVLKAKEQFEKEKQSFVRNMSILLHTTVRIKKDQYGVEMVYHWSTDEIQDTVYSKMVRRKRSYIIG